MITSEKTKAGFAMGRCGDNLAWMLDDGVLTIVGEGEMEIAAGFAPWSHLHNSIAAVAIKDGVTSIGNSAFSGCTNLTSVTIPDSVTSIDGSAFFGCTGLTSVIIPNNVVSVKCAAFNGCTNLTSVTIGNGVTDIDNFAFGGCTGLTDITIPDSVVSIGDYAFCDCHRLTDIYYGGTQGNWNTVKIGIANGALTNAAIHFGR